MAFDSLRTYIRECELNTLMGFHADGRIDKE